MKSVIKERDKKVIPLFKKDSVTSQDYSGISKAFESCNEGLLCNPELNINPNPKSSYFC